MSFAGGNLYPNWLGSASLSIPNNSIVTTVNGETTSVNIVPNVILSNVSTSALNSLNPQEIIALSNVPPGLYYTGFNCTATPGTAWTGLDVLTWLCKVNNFTNLTTRITTRPDSIRDQNSPPRVFTAGGGLLNVSTPNTTLEWTAYYETLGSPPNTGVSGFSWITLQKIGKSLNGVGDDFEPLVP